MQAPHATLRFHADLAELAVDADRAGVVTVPIGHPRSVKDAIEAAGVPHTEIDLVLLNGESVGFDQLVEPGDRVSVYPLFTSLEVPSLVRPEPWPARFVCDVHLGRLAARLRQLGFDTAYANDADDEQLVERSEGEQRWLLTRDRGLLMRRRVTHGYLVRAEDPREQSIEVLHRFGLEEQVTPFVRCPHCNQALERVAKEEVAERLPPRTRAAFEEFARCVGCGQLYWEGSHHDALREFVADVRENARARAPERHTEA